MNFDADTRAGLVYILELAMNNITGMYGLSSTEAKADPEVACQYMAHGSFLLLGILSAVSAFLLEDDDMKSTHLLAETIEALDPVMLQAQGVPRHLASGGGELN